MTVQADSFYAVPTEIDDKQTAAHALAALVHTDPDDALTTEEQIAERLANGHAFAWVARRVTSEVASRVKGLPIKGIYSQKEFQRFYPDNEIAAQVLGYVGAVSYTHLDVYKRQAQGHALARWVVVALVVAFAGQVLVVVAARRRPLSARTVRRLGIAVLVVLCLLYTSRCV